MKQAIFLSILISIALIVPNAIANDDDQMDGWKPTIYEGSVQEGRNVCLGLILADNSDPGIDDVYSMGKCEPYGINPEIVFENEKFNIADALAKIKFQFPVSGGKHYLYFFLIIEKCLEDNEKNIIYSLYDEKSIPSYFPDDTGLSITGADIDFVKTGDNCSEIDENTCSSLDLSDFYNMETGWSEVDDDTPNPEDENDENDSSDDDDNNDDCNCGCDITGRATSFPLALFMFAIGIGAWAISRRKVNKRD